jgi:YegS/Rv2252/BmrU family lipid kinase
MDKKKALILINKTSGTGKAGNDCLDIATRISEAGYEPIVYPIMPGTNFTSETLVTEYDGQIDHIVCSGGDGTLNHVMNAMMGMEKKPTLGYIPSGSTNDFAKGLGIPSAKGKAIEVAAAGKPYTYDVGLMNGHYFNYVAAFGAFSKVSYATDQELKNVIGYAAYVLGAIAELPASIGFNCHMRIETDSFSEEGDYVFGAVCNSASIGGMKLFLNADVKQDDGLMELLLIHTPKNIAELNSIIGALASGDTSNSFITFRQVSKVTFISDENTSWTMDGEFGGNSQKTEIEVVKKAITIMTREDKVLNV